MPDDYWPRQLAAAEREVCDIRICPTCAGGGEVELSGGHDPYTGERCYRDTCPDCDGTGEIEVSPIAECEAASVAPPDGSTYARLYQAVIHVGRSEDHRHIERGRQLEMAGAELRAAGYPELAEMAEAAAEPFGGASTAGLVERIEEEMRR